MKCVLRIGYIEILLPDDKGIGKIMETLSKGVECSYRSYEKACEIRDGIEVGLKILPPATKIICPDEMTDEVERKFRDKTNGESSCITGRSQLLLIGNKDRG